MALMDHITDAVNRFLPQKREKIPQPLNTATGGIGHGFSNHKEDVRVARSPCSCLRTECKGGYR